MAKKNYLKMEADWRPDIVNEGTFIAMTFTGENTKGTRVGTTMKIRKGALPGIIRDIVKIFTADAAMSIRALELVKEAAI